MRLVTTCGALAALLLIPAAVRAAQADQALVAAAQQEGQVVSRNRSIRLPCLEEALHPNTAPPLAVWPASPSVPAKSLELKPDAGHFEATLVTPGLARDGLPTWTAICKELFR